MVDCPTAVDNPVGNNDCTFTKHILWVVVAQLSLTEYGFPPDTLLNFDVTANPDAAENWNYIPMVILTIVIAVAEWRLSGRRIRRLDTSTAESLR